MATALYCEEPIGLGTPAAESLSSLLMRLAFEHRVNPRDLVREVLGRQPNVRSLGYARFFETYAATINGHGLYAETFVSALGKATGASHLASATLLPWRTLFSPNGHSLLSPKRRWCCACWAESISNGGPPYDRLLWSLAPVVCCPWHGAPLADACPSCRKAQPIIARIPLLTHCNHCRCPLARTLKRRSPLAASDPSWLCADFIRMSPTAPAYDLADRLRGTLASVIRANSGGNRAAFCRMAGMQPFALKNLFAKRERPSLNQVLRLLQAIDLCPSEVFAAESPMPRGVSITTPLKHRRSKPRSPSSDRCLVPPLWLVAQDLGVSRSHLKRKYPVEFGMISRARHAFVAAERRELDKLRTAFARRAVDVVRPLGRKRLEAHLREAGLTLRSGGLHEAARVHLLESFLARDPDDGSGSGRQSQLFKQDEIE